MNTRVEGSRAYDQDSGPGVTRQPSPIHTRRVQKTSLPRCPKLKHVPLMGAPTPSMVHGPVQSSAELYLARGCRWPVAISTCSGRRSKGLRDLNIYLEAFLGGILGLCLLLGWSFSLLHEPRRSLCVTQGCLRRFGLSQRHASHWSRGYMSCACRATVLC